GDPGAGRNRPPRGPGRVTSVPAADFAAADAELAGTLESLDGADRYAAWIFELIRPHLGPSILEVGAGHGTFTGNLSEGRRVLATDLSERCVAVLRERFAGDPDVEVRLGDLSACDGAGPFDTAVLVNVLEHIDDDRGALDQLRSLLRPGSGRLVLWVPALAALYSGFDRRIGHHRRYDTAGLRRLLDAAGFDVVEVRYVNVLGAIAWWVFAVRMGRNPTGKGPVRLFDRFGVPVARRLESRFRPPFGQSLFAVASRRT
ncbi:MAG: class I SAM-dependent methyltransferase, partial [Acidimicrobiales bacterium]